MCKLDLSLLHLYFIGGLIYSANSLEIETKICSLDRHEACSQLARSQEVACNYNFHSLECILNINNSVSHVGYINAEEALLAGPLVNNKVVVIGEVKKPISLIYSKLSEPYQTVVVVNKDFQGGFQNLRGKKYCHPGFKYNPMITKLVLEELENKILSSENICNINANTLLEKHIAGLSQFFKSACRPGLWTQDIVLDAELKKKYPNLCEMCGQFKCSVDYKVPMNDSLDCLVKNQADVALSTIMDAEILNQLYPSMFKLLCPDGTVRDISNPCVWTKQIDDLLIAHSDKARALQELVKKYTSEFRTDEEDRYRSNLFSAMSIGRHNTIKLLDNVQSLRDYVSARRTIPSLKSSMKCDVSMRWCTTSQIEQEKCRWFSQASLNQGVQPVIKCTPSAYQDDLSCLEDIKSNKADLFTVSTNYAYTAAKYGLVSIAYPETDTRYVYAPTVVLREGNSAKSISDLRNQRACFPEFGGKEVLAFVHYLQKNGLVEKNVDYGQSLKDFIGEACVPGFMGSNATEVTDLETQIKFCKICAPRFSNMSARYCNADYKNKYYGNAGALDCLADKQGDYAVVTPIEIKQLNKTDRLRNVLCRNNTTVPEVDLSDEDCALSAIVASEVVSRANDKHNSDYVLALREYEVQFGERLEKPFHLFEVFNGTKDLLFKDSTPGIRFQSYNYYIESLKELTEIFKKDGPTPVSSTPKPKPLAASTTEISFLLTLIVLILSTFRAL